MNAQVALVGQGKFAEAETLLDAKRERFPEDPTNRLFSALLEAARWKYDGAESELRAMIEETRAIPIFVNQAQFGLASVLTSRGRLAEAESYRSEASAQDEERGVPGAALGGLIAEAFVDLVLRGDTATAIERVDSALVSHPLSDISPLDRPYFQLAAFYAIAGDPRRARQLWREYEAEIGPDLRGDDEMARHTVQGAVAFAEGQYGEAVDEYRRSDVGECVTCTLYPLARAYEASGQPDSARSVYEQLLSRPDPFRLFADQGAGALTLERLGQLYDERGDWEKAAEYYARFVELWKDADPELQPRVEAAQQRLDEIFAARG
jgi:tetratricopeptide (TPR) repeat protein